MPVIVHVHTFRESCEVNRTQESTYCPQQHPALSSGLRQMAGRGVFNGEEQANPPFVSTTTSIDC